MTRHKLGKDKAFHGWKILFLASFSQFVSAGFAVYLLGLYIETLGKAFSATPGQLGWSSTIFLAAPALLGPLVGNAVDKGHVRSLMTVGAAAMAVGFILLSRSQNILQAGLACTFLIAPGSAMLNNLPAGAMLVQWFERRRGFVLGVAAAGVSLGGLVMPPITAWLFSVYDWRTGSMVLGIFIGLVLAPTIMKIAVSKPADLGQYPDGDDAPPSESAPKTQPTAPSYREILSRFDFWIIAATVAGIYFASVMIVVYVFPFAREQGLDTRQSAFLLSIYAGAAFAGKFIAGWLCDRFSPRRVFTGITAFMAAGLLPMLILDNPVFFPISIFLVGLGVSAMMPAWLSLIAINFGTHSFGRAKGGMSLVLVTIAIIPGPLGGYLHDLYGSYRVAFELLIWILIAGFAVSLFIPKPANES